MKQETLSDKIFMAYGEMWLKPKDLKGFIKKLKRDYVKKNKYGSFVYLEDLDKLLGDKLI